MAIVLNGSTGITTPDIDSTAGFDAADITGTISTAQIADANVTQAKLAGEAVNEAKMQVSNAPTNGYMLTAQSGNTGGLTWAAAPTSSTDFGAVGTYIIGRPANTTAYAANATTSNLFAVSIFRNDTANVNYDNTSWDDAGLPNPVSMSGTWRAMTHAPVISTRGLTALWVRIS